MCKKILCGALAAVSFFVIFTTCKIGLGESVDVEPPKGEISNPPVNAVIRSAFAVSGTWQDDVQLKSVTLNLQNTKNAKKSFTFSGTITGKNWLITVDPLDTSHPIVDGQYLATITLNDGGHKTTLTRSYTIDNTPPVVILQRPSSLITDSDSDTDTYGQSFTLQGQAADDNDIDKIDVSVYSSSDCAESDWIKTITLNNVPPTINLDVAKFQVNVENDYSEIYGHTTKEGVEYRFCKILAYDGAQRYPVDGSAQTDDDKNGNPQETYYLYDEISSSVLSEYKVNELYSIFNGTYESSGSSRAASSQEVIDEVKKKLAGKEKEKGKFALNPANNPTFTVSGRNPLNKDGKDFYDETTNPDATDNNISNNSEIFVEVSPGLDNTPLFPDSLKVYFAECDAYGDYNGAKDANDRPVESERFYPVTERTKSGSGYKFKTNVNNSITNSTGDKFLTLGHTYLIYVDGHDEPTTEFGKGNLVEPNGKGFGFYFASSGAAPNLNCNLQILKEGSQTWENCTTQVSYIPKGTRVRVNGTVIVENGVPKLIINQEEYPLEEKTEAPFSYSFIKEFTLGNVSEQYAINVIASQSGAKAEKSYTVMYDVDPPVLAVSEISPVATIYTDESGTTDGNYYLNGDTTKIKLTISDSYDIVDTTTHKPIIEFIDANEKKLTQEISTPASFTTSPLLTKSENLAEGDLKIRVTAYDRSGNKGVYYVRVDTSSGNRGEPKVCTSESEANTQSYIVKQESDKPSILPSDFTFTLDSEAKIKDPTKNPDKKNIKNSGASIALIVSDDDGLKEIIPYLGGSEDTAQIQDFHSSKSTTYNYSLPTEAGYYTLYFILKDIYCTSDSLLGNNNIYKSPVFMVKVTGGKPIIEIKSEVYDSNDKKVDAIYTNGLDDENANYFRNTITIDSVYEKFDVYRAVVPEGYSGRILPYGSSDTSIIYKYEKITTEPITDKTFIDDKLRPRDSSDYYYYVEATEDEVESSPKKITCKVDHAVPQITIDSPGADLLNTDAISKAEYQFSGSITEDNEIGNVYYKITKETITNPETLNTEQALKDAGFTALAKTNFASNFWKLNQSFHAKGNLNPPESSVVEDTGYKFYIFAIDKAGNVGYQWTDDQGTEHQATRKFDVDMAAPTLTMTPLENTIYNISKTIDSEGKYGSFTLTGTAKDSLGLARVEICYSTEEREATEIVHPNASNNVWTKMFAFGSEATSDATKLKLAEGVYTFKIRAIDNVGKVTETDEFQITVDTVNPNIDTDTLKLEDSAYSPTKWYGSKNIQVTINVTDGTAGSGITKVQVGAKNSSGVMIWKPCSLTDNSTVEWTGSVQFAKDGTEDLYISAKDKAGNEIQANAISVKIDTSAPILEFDKYHITELKEKESTLYINGTSTLTLYGTYYDLQSGVAELNFTVTPEKSDTSKSKSPTVFYSVKTTDESNSSDYVEYADIADKVQIKSWKAVLTNGASGIIETGTWNVIGRNLTEAGLRTEVNMFKLNKDETKPLLKNITLATDNDDYSVYKKTEAGIDYYYVNNQTSKFTISGLAEDNKGTEGPASGVDHVKVTIVNTAVPSKKIEKTDSSVNFYDLLLADTDDSGNVTAYWTEGATATVTVFDKAGNECQQPTVLNIKFDIEGPSGVHSIDTSGKDLFFRLGENDNDDITPSDPDWDGGSGSTVKIDEDVGGKYSTTTYGNAQTVTIRGTFDDTESGVERIYYYIASSKDDADSVTIENFRDKTSNYFTPIVQTSKETVEQQAKRRVFYTDTLNNGSLYDPTSTGTEKYNTKITDINVKDAAKNRYYTSITSTFKATIPGFNPNESNYLVLIAVDNVGNPKLDSVKMVVQEETDPAPTLHTYNNYLVNVDTLSPEVPLDDRYNINQYINPNTTGAKITVTGTASDNFSGVSGFTVKINNGNKEITKDDNTYGTITTANNNTEWTTEILNTAFVGKSSGNNVAIQIEAKDNAGLSKTYNIGSVIVDTVAPTVEIKDVTNAGTKKIDGKDVPLVNKTIEVSGTVTESIALKEDTGDEATLNFYYTTSKTVGANKPTPSTIGNDASTKWKLLKSVKHSPSWLFNVDTVDELGGDVETFFSIAASDKAGNIGYTAPYHVMVDQNTDRPVITLSQLSGEGVTIKTKNVYGSVADDDGTVQKMWYWSKKAKGNKAPDALPTLTDNKGWSPVTVTSGAWTIDSPDADGETTWYFAVADAKGTIFAAYGDNQLKHPYIKFAGATSQVDASKAGVTFKYDTEAPNVEYMYLYKADKGTTTTAATIKANDTDSDATNDVAWSTESNLTFGGKYNVLYAKVVVKESTGMKALTGTTGSLPTSSPVSISYKALNYEQIAAVEDTTTGKYTYYIGPVIMDTTEAHDFKVTVYDAVENTGSANRTIIVDNTAPSEITNVKPAKTEPVDSDVNYRGFVSDNEGGSGILYKTDPTGTTVEEYGVEYCIPTYSQYTAPEGPSGITTWHKPTSMGTVSWEIAFTDSNTIGKIIDYKIIDGHPSVNANYKDYETATDSGMFDIPVWFRLTDAVENVGYVTGNSIRYNADADRPTVQITYPTHNKEHTSGGKTTAYVSAGGTINISGMANDNNGISAVYLQFDMDGDGTFENGVGVDGTPFTPADIVNIPSTGEKGVLATGTKSWYKIFSVSGLNGLEIGSSNKTLNIRAISIESDDKPSKLYSAWSDVLHISVNNEVPNFSDVKLKKFSTVPTDETLAQVEAAATAENDYSPDMYLKYGDNDKDWYLVGDVEVSKESATLETRPTISGSKNSLIAYSDTNKKKWHFAVPVTLDSGSKWSVKITASDNTHNTNYYDASINLDEDAPVFSDTKAVGTKTELLLYKNSYGSAGVEISKDPSGYIQNSNGLFTLAGKVTETGSGFKRLVFYFKRTGTGGSRVYNPMEEHGADNTENRTIIESSKNAGKVYINEEELPVLYVTGTSRSNNISITSALIKDNKNIRVGGLVKIGGVYRHIDNVDSRDSDGTITFTPACDQSYTEAEFVYGMIIDNTGESLNSDGKTVKNDDGDGMVESYAKSGNDYKWDASVDSTNIPDGPIELHCVVFDVAGNSDHGYTTSYVSNNPPRLTSVRLGTDLNADDKYTLDSAEFETFYYRRNSDGSGNTKVGGEVWNCYDESSSWTAKKDVVVIPEFIGGSGDIYYKFAGRAEKTSPEKGATSLFAMLKESDPSIEGTITASQAENKVGALILKNGTSDANTTINTEVGEGTLNTYSFTFWDSTEECTVGKDSQWAILNIKFNQDLVDNEPPVGYINPFYWNSSTDNSVVWNGTTALGHIELENELPDSFNATSGEMDKDPKVSGKIKIEGVAEDETRLSKITLLFAGTSLDATYNASTKKWTSGNIAGNFELSVDDGSGVTQNGHKVKWTLMADTSYVMGTKQADKDQIIRLSVEDAKEGNPNKSASSSTQTKVTSHTWSDVKSETEAMTKYYTDYTCKTLVTAETADSTKVYKPAKTSYYKVDVVPYITNIVNNVKNAYSKNPSVFGRSATGSYPVYYYDDSKRESFKIEGFNLGTNPSVTVNEVSAGSGTTIDVTGSMTSGGVVVTVGTGENAVSSLNNKNNNDAKGSYNDETTTGYDKYKNFYNRQPNNVNNSTLTDDCILAVWNITQVVEDKTVRYPSMRVGSNGAVGWVYGSGSDEVRMKLGDAEDYLVDTSFTQWYDTGVAVDNRGQIYGAAQNGDTGGGGNYPNDDSYRDKTNFKLYAFTSAEAHCRRYSMTGGAYSTGGRSSALENIEHDGVVYSQRIRNPKIVAKSNGNVDLNGAVYIAYYDSAINQIIYRQGTVTSNYATDNTYDNFSSVGRVYYAETEFTDGLKAREKNNDSALGAVIIADSSLAGEYVALGVTSGGKAVVAWYASSAQSLYYKYQTATGWSSEKLIEDGFVGWYVDLVVDDANGVHIAYYDASNGDLKYAYIEDYTKPENAKTMTIDSYLTSGTNISISVKKDTNNNYVPYISTFMSSFNKTAYTIRTAWIKDAAKLKTETAKNLAGVDENDDFTGVWEVMTVPLDTKSLPLDYSVGIGIKGGQPILGYGTQNGLETAILK